jgi:hypothetical protein
VVCDKGALLGVDESLPEGNASMFSVHGFKAAVDTVIEENTRILTSTKKLLAEGLEFERNVRYAVMIRLPKSEIIRFYKEFMQKMEINAQIRVESTRKIAASCFNERLETMQNVARTIPLHIRKLDPRWQQTCDELD